MTLPGPLADYLQSGPDAAAAFNAAGEVVWHNGRATDDVLAAMRGERVAGSLAIATTAYGELTIVSARDVAGLGRDALTGVWDRNVLMSHLEQAVAAARRGRPAAVLFIDLDALKRVNDSAGHATGDELLKAFTTTLRAVVRAEDVVARVGGDEFVVLMHVSAAAAVDVADAVRRRLADAGTKASIGVAAVSGLVAPDAVLAQADRACYAAKAAGGDRVEVYSA